MSETVLETEKLDRYFKLGGRQVRALSDVTIQVKRGEFVSVMGPSGSGKTTLLNMLGCLDKPSSGRVILDGVDITSVPEKALYKIRREKIGFIFQNFNLIPYLSAIENVALPMEGTEKPASEKRQRARTLLKLVGLSEREDHRPQRLSAGEQQRVAIARALANDPAIILADEPTGNLDGTTGSEIIKLLGRLNTTQGTTIIMVTHDSRMAQQTQRILFLSDGKILTKERQGLLTAERKTNCPYCGRKLLEDSEYCSGCGHRL
jgi:ABC-type lipoprotein export system ATPase subunit